MADTSCNLDGTTAGGSNLPASSIALMAIGCGVVAAGSYLAQPLLSIIAPDVGLPTWAASWTVTLCQLGYCVGLLFLAPLSDCVENRQLVLGTMAFLLLALLTTAVASTAGAFLAAAFAIGLGSSVVQMMVSLAAHCTEPSRRGLVVGTVTSGLLAGILLARPISSLVVTQVVWRDVYLFDASVLTMLALPLARFLPAYRPETPIRYAKVISSLWTIARGSRSLQRLSLSQAFLFAAFSLFWGAAPFALRARFGMSDFGLALFALAGAGGALAAPLAGYAIDRGLDARTRAGSVVLVAAGFALTLSPSVYVWAFAAVLIDAGVQISHVTNQKAVLSAPPSIRSRCNSLYIAFFFFGGAAGSAVASSAVMAGWSWVIGLGVFAAVSAGFVHASRCRLCTGDFWKSDGKSLDALNRHRLHADSGRSGNA
ncbi:MFS transporter [Paraburkholderia strydomiana]